MYKIHKSTLCMKSLLYGGGGTGGHMYVWDFFDELNLTFFRIPKHLAR
jgi:hypothetical protein